MNHKGNGRSGVGDRFNAIAILMAVIGTATEGAGVVVKDAIVTAWNWTTEPIFKYASCAVLVVAGVTLLALLGYHLLKVLKRVCSADLPQDEVQLVKAIIRVCRMALEGEGGDGWWTEYDMAWCKSAA